ncbi:MAG: LLM class flavin-dependent oxidoreductase [Chloroflexi bacterium]|nr:LLM class flavin-dependent oxidoreductase [Chloroflexota bacterium]
MSTQQSSSGNGRALEFGLFDWIEWENQPHSKIYEERLKLLEYADKNGFYCYHLAEHHVTPLSLAPSPGVFLAAAAQRTRNIRLGPLVYLLPFYSPLRLLHEVCMIDNLSNGRLDLGVGRGIVPMEAAHYDVNFDDGRDMFQEALDVLIMGMTQKSLNYVGKYYQYEDIQVWSEPQQRPYPPLWYATNNKETVPWIAQHGFNTSTVFDDNAEVKQHIDLYRQEWQKHLGDEGRLNSHVAEPKLGLTRHVYIAPTDAEALKECRAAFETWFFNINFLWDKHDVPIPATLDFDDWVEKEVMMVGSPATVREQVGRMVEESGINYFNSIFAWGDLSHEQVMRSIGLFVEEVMPALR